jgi:hypothetical protein
VTRTHDESSGCSYSFRRCGGLAVSSTAPDKWTSSAAAMAAGNNPHSNATPTPRSKQRSIPLVLHCAGKLTVPSKSLNHMAFGAWRLRRSSASRTDAVKVDVMSYFGVAVLAA